LQGKGRYLYNRGEKERLVFDMRLLFKMMLAPISLFVAFLALMAKWLLTLSSYVVAPLMLYIFGCGIYTVYRQTWDQFLILLVAEFLCFVLFVGATAIVEGVEKFSGWLRDLI
jgi:TctA family transporter